MSGTRHDRARRRRVRVWASTVPVAIVIAAVLTGFAIQRGVLAPAASSAATLTGSPESTTPSPSPEERGSAPASQPTASQPPASQPPVAKVGDKAVLRIPAIGVRNLTTVFYEGSPDDGPGTRIQDKGDAAAPLGPGGGVGPGQIGNLIIAGHRTAAGGPLRRLPELHNHDHVLVTFDDMVYDYEITGSLWITFHDPDSYALQVAPVPGHPGRKPTKSMITLTTCATPEDLAAGLDDFDEHGNPPHRIVKIGVLVDVRPV